MLPTGLFLSVRRRPLCPQTDDFAVSRWRPVGAGGGHRILWGRRAPCRCLLHQDATAAAKNDVYFQSACCRRGESQAGGGGVRKVEGGLSLEAPARTSAAVTQPLLLLLHLRHLRHCLSAPLPSPPPPLPPLRRPSVVSSSAPLNNSEAAGTDSELNPMTAGSECKEDSRGYYELFGVFFVFFPSACPYK